MSSYTFHNHEGREIVATLVGEPGNRHVDFAYDYPTRLSLGRVPLALLLRDPMEKDGWCCMLAPGGDIEGCSEDDLVILDFGVVEMLAAWAQEAALGRVESTEE